MQSSNATTASLDAAPHVAQNVAEIVRLEQRDQVTMGLGERIANRVAAFAGSMLFVCLNILVFGGWVAYNRVASQPFDPYPHSFLAFIATLEAIFLAIFVLISQNRQAIQADRRAKLDLQINMATEQEVTKLMTMIADLQRFVGMPRGDDPDLRQMTQPTHVEQLVETIDSIERQVDPHGAAGPDSAVDTEA